MPIKKAKNWLADKKPGQHEDQLGALARIEEALKKQIKIEIKCSCCADTQKEILKAVQNIQTKLGDIIMSLKDVEAKIDEVASAVSDGLAALNTTLQNEVQEILAILQSQGDTSIAINKLIALKSNVDTGLTNLSTDISNIVTPEPPPVEPSSAKKK